MWSAFNASISPSVNGARTTNNSFVFNGIDVTNMLCCNSRINGSRRTVDAGGGTLSRSIAPAPQTPEEVKLQTSLYDASTGRNGGGIFQVVSKSGTNMFSGTAYHYLQDDSLLANDFSFNRAGTEKPLLRRNEGGVTVVTSQHRNRINDRRNKPDLFAKASNEREGALRRDARVNAEGPARHPLPAASAGFPRRQDRYRYALVASPR